MAHDTEAEDIILSIVRTLEAGQGERRLEPEELTAQILSALDAEGYDIKEQVFNDDPPMYISGRTLDGWRLEREGFHRGILRFKTSDQAKAAATEISAHPVEWIQRGTDAEGNSFFEGGHADVLAHSKRFQYAGTVVNLKLAKNLSDELEKKLGRGALQERWYVAPEYSPIESPVPRAIRAFPGSHYYAAPDSSGYWGVWLEGLPASLESMLSWKEAIDGARRLAIGLKTAGTERRQRIERRHGLIALIALFIVMSLLVIAAEKRWLG